MFDGTSLVLGILIGILILLIIVYICYLTNVWLFTYCANTQNNQCVNSDYYNNPSEAIAAGANINDILFIKDDIMYYKRVPKNPNCFPGSDQTVEITNPQYCDFKYQDDSVVEMRNTFFESYDYFHDNQNVETVGNCVPNANSLAKSGTPVLKWTAY